jgi:acetylornithine deacetylase/succinyl-diaminopimelate desuccinylase-like protein
MIERLIAFNTVSRDSNLALIEWVRDYLQGFGASTRLTHDETGKKANLFATLGDSKKPGLILSGHTDVVPVDGQNWDTDPFLAVERDGIAANVVPKDCVFQFDMRTLPNASPEALHQEIQAYAATLAREMQAVDEKSGIDLQWLSQTVGLAAEETDAIVQWAMRLSRNNRVGKVSYGTEAGLFQKMGVPTVICGPGDIAQAHRPNEFVELEQLAQCEKFMDRILDTGYAA